MTWGTIFDFNPTNTACCIRAVMNLCFEVLTDPPNTIYTEIRSFVYTYIKGLYGTCLKYAIYRITPIGQPLYYNLVRTELNERNE